MGILEAEQAHYIAIARKETAKETWEEASRVMITGLLRQGKLTTEEIAAATNLDESYVSAIQQKLEQGKY